MMTSERARRDTLPLLSDFHENSAAQFNLDAVGMVGAKMADDIARCLAPQVATPTAVLPLMH